MRDLASLRRTFRIRANEAFVEVFGAALIAEVAAQAPFMRLHFFGKPDRNSAYLRVAEAMGPEVRVRALFRDRYVGVVRGAHPLSADGAVSAARYADFAHVVTPHGERIARVLDAALAAQGLRRTVAAVVPGFPAAPAVACVSDLVALLPASFMLAQPAPGVGAAHAFELPVPLETFSISLMWHPRNDADAAHRWLRELVVRACRERIPL